MGERVERLKMGTRGRGVGFFLQALHVWGKSASRCYERLNHAGLILIHSLFTQAVKSLLGTVGTTQAVQTAPAGQRTQHYGTDSVTSGFGADRCSGTQG